MNEEPGRKSQALYLYKMRKRKRSALFQQVDASILRLHNHIQFFQLANQLCSFLLTATCQFTKQIVRQSLLQIQNCFWLLLLSPSRFHR